MEVATKSPNRWSRRLLISAVAALVFMATFHLAGLIGGLISTFIICTVMSSLDSRPRTQVVVGSALIVVFLILAVITTLPPHEAPYIETGTSTPAPLAVPSPSSGGDASWNATALAFEAAHPDLKYGKNYDILQGYITRLDDHHMRAADLLGNAYAAAASDPDWSATSPAPQIVWDDQKQTYAQ